MRRHVGIHNMVHSRSRLRRVQHDPHYILSAKSTGSHEILGSAFTVFALLEISGHASVSFQTPLQRRKSAYTRSQGRNHPLHGIPDHLAYPQNWYRYFTFLCRALTQLLHIPLALRVPRPAAVKGEGGRPSEHDFAYITCGQSMLILVATGICVPYLYGSFRQFPPRKMAYRHVRQWAWWDARRLNRVVHREKEGDRASRGPSGGGLDLGKSKRVLAQVNKRVR